MSFTDKYELFKKDCRAVVDELHGVIHARPFPAMIYHYTNVHGLQGILSTGSLRFSDVFNLNDPSELRHGVDAGLELIKEISDDDAIKKVNHNVAKRISEHLGANTCYLVCCFSRNPIDIGQWRAYADNGHGYALGFDTKILEDAFASSITAPVTRMAFDVFYDDIRLRDVHERFASLARQMMPNTQVETGFHYDGEKYVDVMSTLIDNITLASLLFKHQAYTSEAEYRFLEVFSKRQDKAPTDIQIRHSGYSLIRYRNFDWNKFAPGALKKILVGPSGDRQQAMRYARDCLETFNISGVEVELSPVPYRPVR